MRSYACEIFFKLVYHFIFVRTAISIRGYKFIVNTSFLFLDFKTSLIVLHCFLQSFLNIANLFLKYVFLDSLNICVSLFLNIL